MSDEKLDKILNEMRKKSKLYNCFQDEKEQSEPKKENIKDSKVKSSNKSDSYERSKKSIELDEKINENVHKSYIEYREKHSNLLADYYAENYIKNLRDIGEYNRWSLKLGQKWLKSFYSGKF